MSYSPPKILVVDEDPGARLKISGELKSHNCAVLEADSAKQALSLIAAEKPDLVTTDAELPDMSGFDFCRTLASPKYERL